MANVDEIISPLENLKKSEKKLDFLDDDLIAALSRFRDLRVFFKEIEDNNTENNRIGEHTPRVSRTPHIPSYT